MENTLAGLTGLFVAMAYVMWMLSPASRVPAPADFFFFLGLALICAVMFVGLRLKP